MIALTPDDAVATLDRARALLDADKVQEALAVFEQAGPAGRAVGYFELAEHACAQRKAAEADSWIEKLTDLAANGNDAADLCLYVAYVMFYTRGSPAERDDKAREHLLRAAESGNSTAQMELAGKYFSGSLGLPQDTERYYYWMERAIDQGDEAALPEYARRSLEHGRAAPAKYVEKLAAQADAGDKQAREMLERLRRQQA